MGKCAEHRALLNSETQRGLGGLRGPRPEPEGALQSHPPLSSPGLHLLSGFTSPGRTGTPCSGDGDTFLPLNLMSTSEKIFRGQSHNVSSRPQLSTRGKRVGWGARLRCFWGSPHT